MMIKVSTKIIVLLVFVVLVLISSTLGESSWPVKGDVDISDGFGEYRENRFHTGVDIRTKGQIGTKIFSPVDGYVYRVKMSYIGSGKGLYIKGYDDHIYVFYHLSNFIKKIDMVIKNAQLTEKRYYLDLYFPKDSIKIEKGEFIGYSGQTGAKAPHLHFEKRTGNNYPINPLAHGLKLNDRTSPVFKRIGFKMTDDHSLINDSLREIMFDVSPGEKDGSYKLDTMLYFHQPFGILTDAYDRVRANGMKQTVYKLSLYIDEQLFYQVVFDTLDFETSRGVNLEYDYLRAVNDEKRVRRLFHKHKNSFTRSRAINSIDGIFGLKGDEKIGTHQGEIIAEDCYGNTAELSFKFLWGPPNIYTLDSTTIAPPKSTFFYFTPIKEYEDLKIDSVLVAVNKGRFWGFPKESKVTYLDNGRIKCEIIARTTKMAVLRLFAFSENCTIRDNLFNGILKKGKNICQLDYEIVDDGLLVIIDVTSKFGSESRLEFHYQDSLLGVEYPQYNNMNRYVCFIPPQKKYKRIDKIGYSVSKDTSYITNYLDSLNIYVVGLEDNQEIKIDDNCSLNFNRDNFFEPRFIEVKKNQIVNKSILRLNSDHYQIFPEAFVCQSDFDISLKLKPGKQLNKQSGICWLDEKENRWVWLDNVNENDHLRAKSTGGGSYAAVFDIVPPDIRRLSIIDGRTYYNRRPGIRFLLSDTLSGIEDDRNITIKLDGQWMIPEYNPETKRCQTKPLVPLDYGKHHLGIMVTDRAGNITEQYLNFYVRKGKKK